MEPIPVIPFRWSIEKRQELGSLIDFIKVDLPPGFHEELVASSARILAFAGEAQLYFVGRSPENYFDFLSGAFEEVVELKDRINLFQFSGSRYTYELLAREHQFELEHLRAYMRTIGLSPTQIIGRKIGTTLVDVVYGGGTFRMLVELMHDWARDEKVSWPAVCDKLRIVGITERTKNSPNTWRWQQQADWIELLGSARVKNVSVEGWFWRYIANYQSKSTDSYHPARWANPTAEQPYRALYNREGLKIAVSLYDYGTQSATREALRQAMTAQLAMREAWFRGYVKCL